MAGMFKPQLPFWIVTEQKHVLNPPAKVPCNDPFAPHAFTIAEKLTAFLDERKSGRWTVAHVYDADALLLAVADAKDNQATHICFDPEPDGSGGELVNLADVLAAGGAE
jgi:hypothetical protein